MTFFSFKKTISDFVWTKFGFVVVFLLALAGLGMFIESAIVIIVNLCR